MAIRRKRPHTAATIAFLLIGSWLTGSAAWLPPTTLRAKEPLVGAAVYRPIRPAVVPRNAVEVGYFQPVGPPPKTQKALERVIEFDVVDVPLEVFFDELERAAGVRFVLDEDGFNEAAITSDVEITCRSAGMPLGVALGLMLRDLDLAYLAKDEYVLVTSRESSDLVKEIRLYALADHPLLSHAERFDLIGKLRTHADPEGWFDVRISAVPGAIAICGSHENQEIAASLLSQYARLFAEYDAADVGPSDEQDEGGASTGKRYIPVIKTATPRDERTYFRPMTRRPRTAATLDRSANFDIAYEPMDEFFADLERILGVPFVLDERGIKLARTTPQQKLAFRGNDLTYATALSLALGSHGLKLVPQDDRIVVTCSDDGSFLVETRRYALADHPLLRGDGLDRVLGGLRFLVAEEGLDYPAGYGIGVQDGVLTLSADREMLDRADDVLRQYGRLLAQYDAVSASAGRRLMRSATASAGNASRPQYGFRCLADRPWTEIALRKPEEIAVVDTPLETIFLRAEQALGLPFVLAPYGLEEAALTSDAKVTFHSSPGVAFAAALSRMLAERNLAYLPREHYVLVTSREEEADEIETRVYAIQRPPDLGDSDSLVWEIERSLDEALGAQREPTLMHLLPGGLVVTEDAPTLACIENYLAKKHGLAPPRYAEKPSPPRGPALTLRSAGPRFAPYVPPPASDPFALRPRNEPSADPFGAPPPRDPFAPGSGDPE